MGTGKKKGETSEDKQRIRYEKERKGRNVEGKKEERRKKNSKGQSKRNSPPRQRRNTTASWHRHVCLQRYGCHNPVIRIISRILKVGSKVQMPFSLFRYWEGAISPLLSPPLLGWRHSIWSHGKGGAGRWSFEPTAARWTLTVRCTKLRNGCVVTWFGAICRTDAVVAYTVKRRDWS